jgi:DNA-binding MarR family transcriptional regulator
MSTMSTEDAVGLIARTWARERPDLDPSPLLVIGRLIRLSVAYDVALRPPFAAAGLGSGDFDLLAALRRAGEPYTLTPSELATAMLVTSGAVTKRLDRLEGQSYVHRAASASDGRSRTVTLTDAGRQLVDELMPVHLANEARLLQPLTPDQQLQLAELLRLLCLGAEASP